MVTKLPAEDVEALGFVKADDLSAAIELANRLAGSPSTTFVVPFGNTTVIRAPAVEAGRVAV
jgi:hypothetical protein